LGIPVKPSAWRAFSMIGALLSTISVEKPALMPQ
jgi:hypothetical protein